MTRRRFIALDIETVTEVPDGDDWRQHRPLGVACCAVWAEGRKEAGKRYSVEEDGSIAERMTQADLAQLIEDLQKMADAGYTLVTWNGMGFDLDVLAEESGLTERCQELARGHVDMMFHMFCELGHPVSLKAAAEGSGTAGKTEGMDGAEAVRMWREGDREPVVEYCAQDALATLELAGRTTERGRLTWITRAGKARDIRLPEGGWLTAEEAMKLPHPDTSWMDNPMDRERFCGWLKRKG